MLNFTGQLVKDVEFQNLSGKRTVVPAGEIVVISKILTPVESVDVDGNAAKQVPNTFIATAGNVSFDIEASDFQALHAC